MLMVAAAPEVSRHGSPVLMTVSVVGSPAQALTQDWPVDRTVCLEDMSWDEGSGRCTPQHSRFTSSHSFLQNHHVFPDNGAYAYSCRCGGGFSMSEEEMKTAHEEEEGGGMVVCCDTCSLSVFVTSQRKPPVS